MNPIEQFLAYFVGPLVLASITLGILRWLDCEKAPHAGKRGGQ